MTTLHWTRNKPCKPGWYWWRQDKTLGQKIGWVSSDGIVLFILGSNTVKDAGGEWSSAAAEEPVNKEGG